MTKCELKEALELLKAAEKVLDPSKEGGVVYFKPDQPIAPRRVSLAFTKIQEAILWLKGEIYE